MQETCTQNQLLLSIYGELDCCEDIQLKKELLTNAALAEEYRELRKSASLLDNHLIAPKKTSVQNILERSNRKEREMV